MAAAAQAQPRGVVLYVVPADGDIEQAVCDVGFFLSALEGLGSTESGVLPFPSHEVDPYRGLEPHVGVTSARARALHAIATGTTRVVVASAASLLPRLTSPARLLATAIDLRPGQDIAPTDLAELLVDAGFTREDPADQHGEFAVRGGIVDIFPAGATNPVRLEFIGDTIESIRTYDPGTQRSIKPVDQVQVVPLRDVLDVRGSRDRSSTIFDYLKRARESRVIASERDEVDALAQKLLEQINRSYQHATGEAGQDEDGGASIISAEEWDELSAEDDPEMMSERAELKVRRIAKGHARARAARTGANVPPPGELFEYWDAIAAQLDAATILSHLGLDEPPVDNPSAGGPANAHHVRCQPTVEMRGRFQDWVVEVKRAHDARETTLFVAATPGRAERTIELLKDTTFLRSPSSGLKTRNTLRSLSRSAVCLAASGFRTPVCRFTQNRMSSKKTDAHRRSAALPRRHSFLISAISKSEI